MAKLEDKIQKEWEKYKDENKNTVLPNILLLGISGAGKSSLIHTIFGINPAEDSNAAPQTRGFHPFYGKQTCLSIDLLDSSGYKTASAQHYYDDITNVLHNGYQNIKKIQLIWYCISITGERVEDMDLNTLKRLYQDPGLREKIAVVLTKCDQDDQESTKANTFKNDIIQNIGDSDIRFFEVSNLPEFPFQTKELTDWSTNSLDDEELKMMFVSSQLVDLKKKKEMAEKRILYYSGAAAVVGAAPIPFSHAAILVPVQMKMIRDVVKIYSVEQVASISSHAIVNLVATQLGRSFATSLIKFLPGIGPVVGGVINGGVASAITMALGRTISTICYRAVSDTVKGKHVDWLHLFDVARITRMFRIDFVKIWRVLTEISQ